MYTLNKAFQYDIRSRDGTINKYCIALCNNSLHPLCSFFLEEMMFTSCWYHRPVDGLGNEAGSSFFKVLLIYTQQLH